MSPKQEACSVTCLYQQSPTEVLQKQTMPGNPRTCEEKLLAEMDQEDGMMVLEMVKKKMEATKYRQLLS